MDKEKKIFVFADFQPYHEEIIGTIYVSQTRGKEFYSFEYDQKWLEKGNIILRTVLFLALIPAGIQLLLRLYYDIFFWGAIRGWLDLLWVILYYLSDLIFVPVGYLVMIVLINRLYLFLWKRKKNALDTDGKESV